VNVNPSQQGTVRTTWNLNPSQQDSVGTTDVVQPPSTLPPINTQVMKNNDESGPSNPDGNGTPSSVNQGDIENYDTYFTPLTAGQVECNLCGMNLQKNSRRNHLVGKHDINLNLNRGRPSKSKSSSSN
jgi:hypothetical protein